MMSFFFKVHIAKGFLCLKMYKCVIIRQMLFVVPASPMSIQHATSLLEYSMVSGCDCLDVMITLRHNMIEPLYERYHY